MLYIEDNGRTRINLTQSILVNRVKTKIAPLGVSILLFGYFIKAINPCRLNIKIKKSLNMARD